MKSLAVLLCAWVMWASATAAKGRLVPVGGYETRAECEARRDTMREKAGREALYMMCLPDTVDPRK